MNGLGIINYILSFCVLYSSLCIYFYLLDEEKKCDGEL